MAFKTLQNVFYVHVQAFEPPRSDHYIVEPGSRLGPGLWSSWMGVCRHFAFFDPERKKWIWPERALLQFATKEAVTGDPVAAPPADPTQFKAELKAKRAAVSAELDKQLAELTKAENIPVEQWDSYQYPSHYVPVDPKPTALQRILVSKYWKVPFSILSASVGSGKTRAFVDICNTRACSDDQVLQDSVRIILVVAPLTLHVNWTREFERWTSPGIEWRVHKVSNKKEIWAEVEASAKHLFDGPRFLTGGLVLVTTPQAWSRDSMPAAFRDRGIEPTLVVVDEIQRFFRNPGNSAFKNLLELRRRAHSFVGLTGTPTNHVHDWWALEELMSGGDENFHFKRGTYNQYRQSFDPETLQVGGLAEPGWTFDILLRKFHHWRISVGRVFVALKEYYMADMPACDQQEIGEFAEARLSFSDICEEYPSAVEAAIEHHQKCNGRSLCSMSEHLIALTLITRMQQVSGQSQESLAMLKSWISDFLDKDEPAVIWTGYVEDQKMLASLLGDSIGFINGDQKPEERQQTIDRFQGGQLRFCGAQVEAGGVGLTLTRACKQLFYTIPLSYLSTTQAIGRLHRIGQTRDVTSFFLMTHPVSAFARRIYDQRSHVNEHVPKSIAGLIKLKDEPNDTQSV